MKSKLGIIAGNRLLPIVLARSIREKNQDFECVAVCFKGETSPDIAKYADRLHWINVGELGKLRQIIREENITDWIMAGQISPWRIFYRKGWDEEMISLADNTRDFRPHNIFAEIIKYLQKENVTFLDSTFYLKDYLAKEGVMNNVFPDNSGKQDIDFGTKMISRFVELDIGQTMVVKARSVAALESLEGTDRTIYRGYQVAGRGCIVLKFSKKNQDMRFDVPVVGTSTLKLLRKVRAKSLVLEKDRVIILEKGKFLYLADKWNIAVVGSSRA